MNLLNELIFIDSHICRICYRSALFHQPRHL